MKNRFDNTLLGVVVGIVATIISFFIIVKYIYPFEFYDQSLRSLWLYIIGPKILSLGAIPNLGFFFLFIYTNKLKSARGVLGATIFIAVVVFVLKLV
ncbi:MAG: hypothetical protein CVT95_13345 [Bacteroidetes bacterium HGW-Bacteroidetes-12]|nr:MAG: hypothetical protein CVT95_13345 [Bacteroidetes bacterium HGW-Bacteroidetes-12]